MRRSKAGSLQMSRGRTPQRPVPSGHKTPPVRGGWGRVWRRCISHLRSRCWDRAWRGWGGEAQAALCAVGAQQVSRCIWTRGVPCTHPQSHSQDPSADCVPCTAHPESECGPVLPAAPSVAFTVLLASRRPPFHLRFGVRSPFWTQLRYYFFLKP